jgi:hypothetical protein
MVLSTPALRRHACGIAIGLMLALAGQSAAHAGTDEIFGKVAHDAQGLDDDMLDNLRGRFSSSTGVLEIGVDLRSIWTAPNGNTLTASASIHANAQEIAAGSARISTSASAQSGARSSGTGAAPAPTAVGASPVDGTQGLAQSVQIAGDRNQVSNQLQLDITRRPSVPGEINLAQTPADQRSVTSEAALADGSRASAQVGRGGLQVALSVAGVGSSQQQIGHSAVHQGILQSVRIAADAQSVANSAAIRLTLAPLSQRSMVSEHVMQALRSVQGLRR